MSRKNDRRAGGRPERELAAAIERDDALEEAGMHGDDRQTCWTHQCWAEECASDPWHTRPYRQA